MHFFCEACILLQLYKSAQVHQREPSHKSRPPLRHPDILDEEPDDDVSSETIVPLPADEESDRRLNDLYDIAPSPDQTLSGDPSDDAASRDEAEVYMRFLQCRRGRGDRSRSLPSVHGDRTYRLLGRNFQAGALSKVHENGSNQDDIGEEDEDELEEEDDIEYGELEDLQGSIDMQRFRRYVI
jgi:hypothetical protein